MRQPEADCLFELSWEVCNKVGGIYTVIKSKAAQTMALYNKYYLIGPYFESSARLDFIMLDVPQDLAGAFETLKREGITCYFGRWAEVKGKPYTILIDFRGIVDRKNSIKEMYWNDYKIDSLRGYWDFEEPSLWSYAAGRLIEQIYLNNLKGKKVVAQFHEWLSGFGLLYLKKNCPRIATVFTTHATTLGRSIAGNGVDLYSLLNSVDPMREAYNNKVEAKHLTEKAAAQNADIFTTVSEITSIEAEHFLGRKADVLVINGLDIDKFPTFEETSIKHITSRDKIREFLTYYFFPYYTFDMSKTLIFYTVGRYEFRNKGYDILIKALGRLNEELKKEAQENPSADMKQIAMFFWIPMEHHGLKLEALENKNYYMHIKNYLNANAPELLTKLMYEFISKKEHINDSIFAEGFLAEIKKDVVAFERSTNPPISTHNIDESNNAIVNSLKDNGLLNRKEDVIKVIVEPVYLDGTDGFVDLAYYDAMVGCHLGLFPSYYEPWGYTPLESAALGVPALTTDLSGFGMFVKKNSPSNKGVFVLDRLNRSDDAVVKDFVQVLYRFSKLSHAERVDSKLNAKELSTLVDWKTLIDNYVTAHNAAIHKAMSRAGE